VWVEKSTQNDWLLPLARAERVTLVTGVGELSVIGKAGSRAPSTHANLLPLGS
jgi:hypothetical protein